MWHRKRQRTVGGAVGRARPHTRSKMSQPRSEWNDAVAKAKKELGFRPNEFVEDWGTVVAMAKVILAGGQEEVHYDKYEQQAILKDKTILARYLSGNPIPTRLSIKRQEVQD